MITAPLIGQDDTPGGLIGSQCQPSDPLVYAPPAIQLETVTARQLEDTEASSAESDKESNAEARPTSKYNLNRA